MGGHLSSAELRTRREVFRLVAAAGLGCLLPWGRAGVARGQALAGQAPLFVSFEAEGAYDVTLFCDPKGITQANAASPPNTYQASTIKQIGAFRVAPQLPAVVDFFTAWAAKTLVINGIDGQTIDHATGTRSSMSGNPATNSPVTGALIAAALGDDMPSAFMSNGGYNYTDNIVGNTGLGGGIVQALNTPASGGNVHRPEAWATITKAMAARNDRVAAQAVGALRAQRLALFNRAFNSTDSLTQLVSTLSDLASPQSVPTASPAGASLTMNDGGLAQSMQVAVASFAHGQSAAAQFVVGGFDSHSDNDAQQTSQLTRLFSAMDYFLRLAAHAGISDRLVLHLGSDFSRTPRYNPGNGKDHWPTTSCMFISPGASPRLPVGQVVGKTDADFNPIALDPKTLAAVGAGGVTLQPGHVHDAIRRLMGIDKTALCQNYTLHMNEQLPLLG